MILLRFHDSYATAAIASGQGFLESRGCSASRTIEFAWWRQRAAPPPFRSLLEAACDIDNVLRAGFAIAGDDRRDW